MTPGTAASLQPGERVDVLVRGAVIDSHGGRTLTVSVPGRGGRVDIPLVDDEGRPTSAVTVVRPGGSAQASPDRDELVGCGCLAVAVALFGGHRFGCPGVPR